MTAQTLRGRLKKLENRFGTRRRPPIRFAIRAVNSEGETTRTIFYEEGKEMRELPGRAPLPDDWPRN
jgi:hypothetical protein